VAQTLVCDFENVNHRLKFVPPPPSSSQIATASEAVLMSRSGSCLACLFIAARQVVTAGQVLAKLLITILTTPPWLRR
jgi:hypothetical protein